MPFENALAPFSFHLLSLLRIMTGLLFLAHGTAKLLGFPPMPMFDNIQLLSIGGISGMLELVGGILIVLGLFTRPVAFILSGEMAFAYFIGHAPQDFFPIRNGGDAAILYCFIFLYIAAAGPGPFSLDTILRKRM